MSAKLIKISHPAKVRGQWKTITEYSVAATLTLLSNLILKLCEIWLYSVKCEKWKLGEMRVKTE